MLRTPSHAFSVPAPLLKGLSCNASQDFLYKFSLTLIFSIVSITFSLNYPTQITFLHYYIYFLRAGFKAYPCFYSSSFFSFSFSLFNTASCLSSFCLLSFFILSDSNINCTLPSSPSSSIV